MSAKTDYPVVIYTKRSKIKPYNKRTVLKAICMYSKWHYSNVSPAPCAQLFKARMHHGTQFLIDMFVLSEVYIKHFPIFAMHKLRTDIMHVLNSCPNYRILYEDN